MKEQITKIYTREDLKKENNMREVVRKERISDFQLLKQAENIIEKAEGDTLLVGQGSRARVVSKERLYHNENDNRTNDPDKIVIKKNVFVDQTFKYQVDLEEEGHLHVIAAEILSMASIQDNNMVKTPNISMYVENDKKESYLAMETIQGKTLWRLSIEAAMENNSELKEKVLSKLRKRTNEEIDMVIDYDIDQVLIGLFKDDEKVKKEIMRHASNNPFLTFEQAATIIRSIGHLNSAGFYHRDLHEKNVMIDKKGAVYFIDFGTALYDPSKSETNPWIVGNNIIMTNDADMIAIANQLVRYTDEEKKAIADQKKHTNIKKGTAIFEKYGIKMDKEEVSNILDGNNTKFNNILDNLTNSKDYSNIVSLLLVLGEAEKELLYSDTKKKGVY